jgi:WD40 repeat protein
MGVAFSPDGQYFAACAERGGVTVWRIKSEGFNSGSGARLGMERIARLPRRGMVWSLAFSPDSDLLAWVENEQYGSPNNTVHLWDLAMSRERAFPPVRLAEEEHSIAFHPNTKHLILVAEAGVAEAWDVATKAAKRQEGFSFGGGESEERIGIHSLGGSIALSSDGAWLASSHGNFVTIWDTARGNLLLKLPEEHHTLASLWSPKRELLAVGSSDGGLVIWNLPKINAQLDEIGLGW